MISVEMTETLALDNGQFVEVSAMGYHKGSTKRAVAMARENLANEAVKVLGHPVLRTMTIFVNNREKYWKCG